MSSSRILIRSFGTRILMPKKKEKSLAAKGKEDKSVQKVPDKTAVSLNKDGNLLISIHVKPGAKLDAITDVSEDFVGVQISAPPQDGEANSQIIKYFSELLNVRKSDVDLKGGKSRDKVLTITSTNLSVNEVLNILLNESGKS